MKIKSSALLLSAVFLACTTVYSQEQELGAVPEPQTPPSAESMEGKVKAKGGNLQPAGQVVWISGTVKATYPEQTPRILVRGAMVYEKDTIFTDDSSSGQISLTDNSMLTLNPQSTLVIEQYYFNEKKPQQGGQSIMNLLKGGFRTVTGFVAKATPANYQMKTPVATIGVRGTDFHGACQGSPASCAFALLRGEGLLITNQAGVYHLTPESPYASIAGYTTHAVITKTPSSMLGTPPTISPANAPPPGSNSGGGNCGILIH